MNERIRELVRQAVISVDIVTGNEALDDELAKMYIPDCFAEKFAELIVKECAQVAFEGDLKRAIGQWGSHSDILKHFGVEHDVVKTFRS